ncbi:Crp/Fnr family transcriptional regulator [Granulosicoccus sp. 3-233]|uniref:Crp/Fnr family transcriptional regulator n=1 Tax=Granulosicoccus sp. 3-233 TaxID=3417969 RepID=UPI003D357DFA
MTGQSIEGYLATHDFFEGLDERSKKFLADSAVVRELSAGDILFSQAESADKFYLLRSGEVSVQVPALMGPALQIQKLKEGQILGWSWMIPPYRWNFQALALEDATVLEFDGSIILARCEQEPTFGYQLLKRFAALMSERLDAARQKMMDQWDPPGFA